MAATVNQIITRAYRENNLIPIGKEPTPTEISESLLVYRALVDSWFGNDIGQFLVDWEAPPKPTSMYPSRFPLYPAPQRDQYYDADVWRNPPPNVRVICNATNASGIFFPPTPPDGARIDLVNVADTYLNVPWTLDGNGRLINGAPVYVLNIDSRGPSKWFYRGDLANWVRLTEFGLADENPFPTEFDDYCVAALAIRRAPAYNKEVNEETVRVAQHGAKLLKTRYDQSANVATFPGAWRFNSYQSYGTPWRSTFGGF